MTLCPSCNNPYEALGQHYSKSDCEWPEIDDHLESVLTGLLLGDGYINKLKPNQYRLTVTSKSETFLEHLHSEWPWLFSETYMYRTAEEAADSMRDSGPSSVVNDENYNDYYRVHTVCHPHFTEMREWYSSGKKKFPDNLELSNTAVKYWYVGDGTLSTQHKNPFARISTRNEADRPDFLVGLLPFNATFSSNYINIPTSETQEFLDWIGEPVPGYEYKWNESLKYGDCQ